MRGSKPAMSPWVILHSRFVGALMLAAGILAVSPGTVSADLVKQWSPDHSCIADDNGEPIWDDTLAVWFRDLLEPGYVKDCRDAKFLFQSCYGGGMLDDIARTLNVTKYVAGSASTCCQPSNAPLTVAECVEFERPTTNGVSYPEHFWSDKLKEELGQDQTLLSAIKEAGKNNEVSIHTNYREDVQWIASADGADIKLKDAGATSHHAILWGGQQDIEADINDLSDMRQILIDSWGDVGPNVSITMLSGDGFDFPSAWGVQPATKANLKAAIESLKPIINNNEQFFFYAVGHGGQKKRVPEWLIAEKEATTKTDLDLTTDELNGMNRTDDNIPALRISAMPIPAEGHVTVKLNDTTLGTLESDEDTTTFVVPEGILDCHNSIVFESLSPVDITITLLEFFTGAISSMPPPIGFEWNECRTTVPVQPQVYEDPYRLGEAGEASTTTLALFTGGGIVDCDNQGVQGFDLSGLGNYTGLFSEYYVVQEDQCTFDPTCVWGFFEGSWSYYDCRLHPEQATVPYGDGFGTAIHNEVRTPPIAITGSGSSFFLKFKVYRDLALTDLVFYTWRVRSFVGGNSGEWRNDGFAYYGDGKDEKTHQIEIGPLIEVGADSIQAAVGVIDMYPTWGDLFDDPICHSHAPLIDDIEVVRANTTGPAWSVNDIDLFSDNFPDDGSLTGKVRLDMAQSVHTSSATTVRPGDSVVVNVSDPTIGLGVDATFGGAAVYLQVFSTGGQAGDSVSGDLSRWPSLGASDGWTTLRMDSVRVGGTNQVPIWGKYCVDLNDSLFSPPDTIYYYFSAKDAIGNTTYWSRWTGAVTCETQVRAQAMEAQCLPTGNSDILLVIDYASVPGGDWDFDFATLGIQPDQFHIMGAPTLAGNELTTRATVTQATGAYQTIVCDRGSLIDPIAVPPMDCPRPDFWVEFVDQHPGGAGLYLGGEDMAEYIRYSAEPAAVTLRSTYINFDLIGGNHQPYAGLSPMLVASGSCFEHGGVPDTAVAFGGCPIWNDFDVLMSTGLSSAQMDYGLYGGTAVVSQVTPNAVGDTARVMLSGVGLRDLCSLRSGFPTARLEFVADVIKWLSGERPTPVGVGGRPAYSNYLADNYPNPFNPVTTIEYGVKMRAHVSLRIYNVAGQLVKTLVDEVQAPRAGGHKAQWIGRNNGGQPVASGVYFYRLTTDNFTRTKKMVLLK